MCLTEKESERERDRNRESERERKRERERERERERKRERDACDNVFMFSKGFSSPRVTNPTLERRIDPEHPQ